MRQIAVTKIETAVRVGHHSIQERPFGGPPALAPVSGEKQAAQMHSSDRAVPYGRPPVSHGSESPGAC